MCGIVGYTGKNNASEILFEGLKMLEYRGYDSAGLAVVDDFGKILIIKKKGHVESLYPKITNLKGNCGIGHTRWATHGKPMNKNSHPHSYKKITLVHNGIIENFEELKKDFIKSGHVFISDTDTEIIAHLLNDYCDKYGGDTLKALREISKVLKGTFALAVLNSQNHGSIYLICRDSSLVVGCGSSENFIASDYRAFIKHTNKALFLKNEEIAVISSDKIVLYDKNDKEILPDLLDINGDYNELLKGGHKHFMHKEIFESPDTLKLTMNDIIKNTNLTKLVKELFKSEKKIIFLGCGTAYHACLLGKHLFERLLRKTVDVQLASEFCYNNPLINENTIVVAVSQSGETADTIESVKLAKDLGAKTLAVCNNKSSRITLYSDYTILTKAGSEIGVAATKTYLAQILVFYLITVILLEDRKPVKTLMEELENIPKIIGEFLKNEKDVKEISKKLHKSKSVFFLGKNLDLTIAEEASLKLKEISYIFSDAYAAGELKHGTLALINKETTIIAILTQSDIKEKTLNALHEVKSRGGKIVLVTQFEDLNFTCDYTIKLPKTNEILMPLIAVIPMQLLAYHISDLKKYNPDKPRHLAKSVTVR